MLEERVADKSLSGYSKEYYTEELDKRGKGKAGAHRRCSFCETQGHDRRTCTKLEAVVETQAASIIEGRKKILEKATNAGFGVGSLIEFRRSGYVDGTWISNISTIGIVRSVAWSEITHRSLSSHGGSPRCVVVHYYDPDEKKETTKTIRLPFEVIDDGDFQGEEVDEDDRRRKYRIIGPSSGPVTKPDDFLDISPCKKIAKEWMRDQKAYQWGG